MEVYAQDVNLAMIFFHGFIAISLVKRSEDIYNGNELYLYAEKGRVVEFWHLNAGCVERQRSWLGEKFTFGVSLFCVHFDENMTFKS